MPSGTSTCKQRVRTLCTCTVVVMNFTAFGLRTRTHKHGGMYPPRTEATVRAPVSQSAWRVSHGEAIVAEELNA